MSFQEHPNSDQEPVGGNVDRLTHPDSYPVESEDGGLAVGRHPFGDKKNKSPTHFCRVHLVKKFDLLDRSCKQQHDKWYNRIDLVQ